MLARGDDLRALPGVEMSNVHARSRLHAESKLELKHRMSPSPLPQPMCPDAGDPSFLSVIDDHGSNHDTDGAKTTADNGLPKEARQDDHNSNHDTDGAKVIA